MKPIYKKNDDSYQVSRGGNWGNLSQGCRSASRCYASPGLHSSHIGFRPSKNVKK